MKIIDLTPELENLYFCCLEDWSEEMKEAGDHKACWYQKMKDKGLRVKLAQDDKGNIGGMIQYIPAEHSFVDGNDLYVVLCVWVHGYKKGRGNFQKKGMGKALLNEAEKDVRKIGARGLVAWGVSLPVFMRASWFKKQGYQIADKDGMMRLLWKPFAADASVPKLIKQKRHPLPVPGKVAVSMFINGWCPAQNIVYERMKQAIIEHIDKIDLKVYHTIDKEILDYWGISDALFIDGKRIRTGPPPSLTKIRKLINRKVSRIKEIAPVT